MEWVAPACVEPVRLGRLRTHLTHANSHDVHHRQRHRRVTGAGGDASGLGAANAFLDAAIIVLDFDILHKHLLIRAANVVALALILSYSQRARASCTSALIEAAMPPE